MNTRASTCRWFLTAAEARTIELSPVSSCISPVMLPQKASTGHTQGKSFNKAQRNERYRAHRASPKPNSRGIITSPFLFMGRCRCRKVYKFWTALRTIYRGDKSQICDLLVIKLQQSMVWNSFGLEERGLERVQIQTNSTECFAINNKFTRNDRQQLFP